MAEGEWASTGPEAVLGYWFPEDGHEADLDAHRAFWTHRMRGGVSGEIRARFAELARAAARGELDHWAETPRGRLALVIALDQFSRSVWRDTPGAFAQDLKAARLVLEGLGNGHYDALTNVWEKAFWLIALSHCEGPGHLERMDRVMALARALVEEAPEHLQLSYRFVEDQGRLGREVVAAFGRHPHRNQVLGRISTRAEEAYLAAGRFPHQREIPSQREAAEALLASRQSLVAPQVPSADQP
jgi:uncharacterized protein (DUF924 family)